MAAPNTEAIFTKTPVVGTTRITAANARNDGNGTIGTDMFLLLTAGANGGTFVPFVKAKAAATAAGTSTAATVIRLYLSTQSSGATTSANTKFIGEVPVPIVSAANSTGVTPDFVIPVGFAVPTGSSLLVSSHVAPAASTEYHVIAPGGDY